MPSYFDASQPFTASPVSAYMEGRAMQMAYEQDKLQRKILQAQVDALPAQMEMQRQQQAIEYQTNVAALQRMVAPETITPADGGVYGRNPLTGETWEIEPRMHKAPIRLKPYKKDGYEIYEEFDPQTNEKREIGRNPIASGGAGGSKAPRTRTVEREDATGRRYKVYQKWDEAAGDFVDDESVTMRPTESEARNAELTSAMEVADSQINSSGIGNKFAPSLPQRFLFEGAIDPNSGKLTRAFYDSLQDDEARNYFDTALSWIDPIVRKRTGAAVRAEEFPNMLRMFFPVTGDDAAAIARKAERRKYVLIAMRAGTGNVVPRFTESVAAEMEAEGRRLAASGGGDGGGWETRNGVRIRVKPAN